MRILFFHPTSYSDGYPEPHLGLGYLMGVAKNYGGIEYELYDHDHHSKQFDVEELIAKFKPDVYAVSFMTPQYGAAIRAIKRFKQLTPDAVVFVGGAHPSSDPNGILQEIPEIDYLARGEGEQTFIEFLDYWHGKIAIEEVSGLGYYQGGEVILNEKRPLMARSELDDYHVDWETIMRHGPYMQRLVYEEEPVNALAVITTRGCPYECTFCDEVTIWERKVRTKSIDNVVSEMKHLRDTYDVWHFNILDDTFTLNPKRVKELCGKLKELNVKWRVTAKVNNVSPDMARQMREGGCQLVAFGVESGDEEVLRLMKKEQTLDDVRYAFKLVQDEGMISYALCMVGNIGEDMAAVKRTAKFVGELNPDLFSCAIMTPYPGTENYTTCEKNGWILHRNWDQWCPSVLKMKDYKPVSRTDKMTGHEMLRAYYYMNRYVLIRRYQRKYGTVFPLNPSFFSNEVMPRMKTIGVSSFGKHVANLLMGDREVPLIARFDGLAKWFGEKLGGKDQIRWRGRHADPSEGADEPAPIEKATSREDSYIRQPTVPRVKAPKESGPGKKRLPVVA